MEQKKTNTCKRCHGFSLVELLVAMAITGVVMAAVFKIYTTQQDSYLVQEQVAEMQQNGRIAKYVMTREIRMAGHDPTGLAGEGFISAGGNIIHFTMDITGGESDGIDNDGDLSIDEADEDYNGEITFPGDDITYSVSAGSLLRNDGSGNQSVVENIDAIGFAYAFDNDGDGSLDTDAGQVIWAVDNGGIWFDLDENDDGSITAADAQAGESTGIVVNLADIRAVKIWILARTGREDRAFADTSTYVVADQRVNANVGSRYHLLTTTIKCRNMAL